MLFLTLNIIIMWLVGLLSIGILGGGIYIVYQWYIGELVEIFYLLGGSAMILWSIVGRHFSLPLLRRPGTKDSKLNGAILKNAIMPDGAKHQ